MTKKLLKEAVLELLEKNSLERITVTDICTRADVNRSTFYAHYEDIRQLLRSIEDDMLEHVPVLPMPYADQKEEESEERLAEFLRYVQDNPLLFRVMLVRRDSGTFFHRAVDAMMEAIRRTETIEDECFVRYDCAYRLNGTIGIIREWIEDGFPMTAEELATLIWYRRINIQVVR